MKLLYTSTLCVSSEKSPTCGQILPILIKLEEHFTVAEQDTVFISGLKEKVWGDLEKRYLVFSIIIKSLCFKKKEGKSHNFNC